MGMTTIVSDIWNKIKGTVNKEGYFIVIRSAHERIHQGVAYSLAVSTSDLDTNPIRFSFTTNSKEVGLRVSAHASGEAALEKREAPTGGVANGSDSEAVNRNRCKTHLKSSLSSTLASLLGSITVGATAGTGGTVIATDTLGVGKTTSLGTNLDEAEWVLAANTIYVISLTSSTNAIIATLTLMWHETEED